jgi:hypothetical protein
MEEEEKMREKMMDFAEWKRVEWICGFKMEFENR